MARSTLRNPFIWKNVSSLAIFMLISCDLWINGSYSLMAVDGIIRGAENHFRYHVRDEQRKCFAWSHRVLASRTPSIDVPK